MNKTTKATEKDLYGPVQTYFEKLGFKVQAEVNDCDVVAYQEKTDTIIITELKLNLNITLLMQAAKRQKITNHVYLAIPKPKISLRRKRWRDLVHLVRRLELGLILVSFEGRKPSLDVVCEPKPFERKKSMKQNNRQRKKIIEEIKNRRSNQNVGGSSHILMMTAYKEMAIQIAYYLDHLGPMSAKELEKIGTRNKTYSILYNNYYQWFERVDRGVYGLTEKGKNEYKTYPEVIELYRKTPLK